MPSHDRALQKEREDEEIEVRLHARPIAWHAESAHQLRLGGDRSVVPVVSATFLQAVVE